MSGYLVRGVHPASAYLAGRESSSFLGPRASVGHLPQVLQGIHNMDAKLLAHFQVADVDVEDGDDGDLSEVHRVMRLTTPWNLQM